MPWYLIYNEDGHESQVAAVDEEHAARASCGVPPRVESQVHRLWVGRWDRRRKRNTVQMEQIRVVVDPVEPHCSEPRHEWDDAPVRGVDGGIVYTEECTICGLVRRVSTAEIDENGQRYRSIRYS